MRGYQEGLLSSSFPNMQSHCLRLDGSSLWWTVRLVTCFSQAMCEGGRLVGRLVCGQLVVVSLHLEGEGQLSYTKTSSKLLAFLCLSFSMFLNIFGVGQRSFKESGVCPPT